MQDSVTTQALDIAVVGAGPAGLLAAITAATGVGDAGGDGAARSVVLFERNGAPGKKLLLTGGGQCNLTHGGPIGDFLPKFHAAARFVKPALMEFPNDALRAWFAERGLRTVQQRDGKVFPASLRARDVLETLVRTARQVGVQLRTDTRIEAVSRDPDGGPFRLETSRGPVHARVLVLATGGKSFPATGSTGDGARLALGLGHTLNPLRPGLAPVIAEPYPFASCAGISRDPLAVSLWRGGRKLAQIAGPVLFTHQGLSGPAALDLSREVEPGDTLQLGFVPGLTDDALLAAIQERPGKRLRTLIASRWGLPDRLADALLELAAVTPETPCQTLSRAARKNVLKLLSACPIQVRGPGDFRTAMVTVGGVSRSEVNRQTCESRLVPGLFFCGEILDVDGDTGGFNLQFAFSSGRLAGRHARRRAGDRVP